jgi:hypothetical protein
MATSTNQARVVKNQSASPVFPEKDDGKYSLHINIGWTFSNSPKNLPSGKYTLRVAGRAVHDGKGNRFSSGKIIIDKALKSKTGPAELIIKLTDGSLYRAAVKLDGLKPVQTPEGLACRLTNLGFYAGDGKAKNRLCWAIRAFKRVMMNDFTRNKDEDENNEATPKFFKMVQSVYGGRKPYPGDDVTKKVRFTTDAGQVPYCGMFGKRVYRYEENDDSKDKHKSEPIAGDFTLYLRPFDPDDKDPKCRGSFSNRVNLPQPVHMAQFVLFELGYWLIAEEGRFIWKNIEDTWTCNEYRPNGAFGQHTQLAVQCFQRNAEMAHAIKENVTSKEQRYLSRVLELVDQLPEVSGNTLYPVAEEINGVLNQATKKVLQAWADEALRCPVVILPSKDYNNEHINAGSFDSDYQPKERQYQLEQIDHYFKWRYVTPDESIWVKMLHGAFATGEIISGGVQFFGGVVMAMGGDPVGLISALHGENTFFSGCNDIAGVFTENRVGFGYGNLNMLKTCYQKAFGEVKGSILYTGVDFFVGIGGVKAAFKSARTRVKLIDKKGYEIYSLLSKITNLRRESWKTTVVLGYGERVLEGFIFIRDGSILISDIQGTVEDMTDWYKKTISYMFSETH